jgi:hypothetical protein
MYISISTIRLLMAFSSLLVGVALTGAAAVGGATEHSFATSIADAYRPMLVAGGRLEESLQASGVGGGEKQAVASFLNGVSGEVYSIAVNGNNIYIGGAFNAADDIALANVAKWNGSEWSAISNGLDAVVYALAWDDKNKVLYAGGNFSGVCSSADCHSTSVSVNHVAAWDGDAWVPLGNGVNGDVYALALDTNNDLYVGGNFTSICTTPDCASRIPAHNIARWNRDSQTWVQLVAGGANNGVNAAVRTLVWDGPPRNVLYVGGDLTSAGGVNANRIAKWDPKANSWARLNFGLSGTVRALTLDGTSNHLYVGGDFVGACVSMICSSPTPLNYVARWDGAAWSALESGVSSSIYALALDTDHNLYAGGDFSSTGTLAANRIAKWSVILNAGSWSALGGGLDHRVNALMVSGGNIYVAGWFSLGKDTTSTGIAKWMPGTGTGSWSALAHDTGGRPTVPTSIPTVVMPTGTLTPISKTWSPFGENIFAIPVLAVLAIAILIGIRVFGPRTLAASQLTGFVVVGLVLLLGVGAFSIGLSSMSIAILTVTPDLQARATRNSTLSDITPKSGLVVPPITSSGTATSRPGSTASPTLAQNSPTPTIVMVTSTPLPVTNTPAPTVTNTATIPATASPTRTPTVAPRYPAVQLREPRNEQRVQGEGATFEWQDLGIEQSDHYELWLRPVSSVTWGKSFKVAGSKFVLFLRDGMDYGEYIWSVFVLDAQAHVVSQLGEERKMIWQPRGAPNSSDSNPPPVFTK